MNNYESRQREREKERGLSKWSKRLRHNSLQAYSHFGFFTGAFLTPSAPLSLSEMLSLSLDLHTEITSETSRTFLIYLFICSVVIILLVLVPYEENTLIMSSSSTSASTLFTSPSPLSSKTRRICFLLLCLDQIEFQNDCIIWSTL